MLRCLAKSKQKSKYLIDIRSTLYLLEKFGHHNLLFI
uniref:Uncharacterized protein n=1 Tax=Siphoviridae sp. ctqPo10 TaxID=2827948 RepID=A0A8S5SUE4_9CAUD|nr:MAG TPA: hypothetical protein [Siphoviridae sp. ctqPo10]